jgi:hypothetical protein
MTTPGSKRWGIKEITYLTIPDTNNNNVQERLYSIFYHAFPKICVRKDDKGMGGSPLWTEVSEYQRKAMRLPHGH